MNRALLIWVSVLAGLQVVAGAAALTDIIGGKFAAVFVLVIGAAQVGTATYQHGLYSPVPVPPKEGA